MRKISGIRHKNAEMGAAVIIVVSIPESDIQSVAFVYEARDYGRFIDEHSLQMWRQGDECAFAFCTPTGND